MTAAADIADRTELLVTIGNMVATDVCRRVQQDTGYACDIKFNKDRLEPIIASYFKLLKEFKDENNFPDGDRINGPKIAALTIFVLLTTRSHLLFSSKTKVARPSHYKLCYFTFCLYVLLTFVMSDKIPKMEQDYIMAFVKQVFTDKESKNSKSFLYALCMYTHEMYRKAATKAVLAID